MTSTNERHRRLLIVVSLTVAAMLARPAFGGLLVYEGFEYSSGAAINGKTGGFGWGGANAWRCPGTSNPFETAPAGSSFDTMPVSGRSAERSLPGGTNSLSRNLSASGLTDDETTLWFCLLYSFNHRTNAGLGGARQGFAFSTADFLAGAATPTLPGGIGNDAVGIQVTSATSVDARAWINGGASAADSAGNITITTGAGVKMLVGKIDWGTAETSDGSYHIITVYKAASTDPAVEPTGGKVLSGINIDQSALDRFTAYDNRQVRIDEIRFAKSWADLVGPAALAGDANLDGIVDTQDFTILKANLGLPGGWGAGDFNFDNIVDTQDFTILKAHLGETGTAAGSALPEPATLSLLALGALAALRRKRESRR
ncbi:MAG: dockerin type I domain-containing protein [Planctomycetota bacterium]|jgi:hypothetical protein